MPLRVLILCTRNSARSQMAEALFGTIGGGRVVAASAGSDPGPGVHPMAVEALAELGIDWHGRPSQGITAVERDAWDAVITVCDAARDACPYMPTAGLTVHWGLQDPAAVTGNHESQLQAFRVTRDILRTAIAAVFDALDRSSTLADALAAGELVIGTSSFTSPGNASA